MPNNELIPIFEDGDRPTGYCTATVRGRRLVKISADITGGMFGTENIQVAESTAGYPAVGVACYDGASGDNIPLLRVGLVPLIAGAAITAGDPLMSDAQGRVVPYTDGATNHRIGVALTAAAAAGDDVAVALQIG